MRTIDDLPVYTTLDSNPTSSLFVSPFNFRLLLASVCTDRIAYYGLRSVLILYAISQFEFTRELVMYHYSFITLIVCLAQLLGGVLGDFLLGATRGMLIGFGICIIGAVAVSINDPIFYYIGVFLIACGTGFYRANSFSFIAHFTHGNLVLLEKRFISMYAFLNLGAFISSIFVGLIGEFFGYFYSFMTVLGFYVISFGLILIISQSTPTNTSNLPAEAKKPLLVPRNLISLILTFVASAVFWILFELYSTDIASAKIIYIGDFKFSPSIFQIILGSSIVLTLLLIIPYYFLAKYFSLYLKMAITLIIIGGCWSVGKFYIGSEIVKIGFGAFILFTLFEAIADIFMTPTALTLIAKHGRRRYYGLIYGIYSLLLYGGMRLSTPADPSKENFTGNIFLIFLLLSFILLFFLLPYLFKSTESETVPLEHDF